MGVAPGRGIAGGIGRDPLGLEPEEETEIAIGEREDESAVVKHAVVPGVRSDIALVEVNVVDAVETVGIAELDVDRLVEVPVELRAERIDLAAGVLALVEIQRQQILQVVAARAARRWQQPAELPVEQRRLDVVESMVGVPGDAAEPGCQCGQRRQQGMTGERVDHPERDVGTGVGLHVHGNPPGLAAVLEHADLQMRSRGVVFALVPVGPASKHTVKDRHVPSFEPSRPDYPPITQTSLSISAAEVELVDRCQTCHERTSARVTGEAHR